MESCVFYGELSEEWEKNWGEGDDPFKVLKEDHGLSCGPVNVDVFGWANKHCYDEVQVDWGSYAWKCKGSDLIELHNSSEASYVYDIETVESDKTYGVVFIELS